MHRRGAWPPRQQMKKIQERVFGTIKQRPYASRSFSGDVIHAARGESKVDPSALAKRDDFIAAIGE